MNKKVNNTGASLRISNDVLTKIAEVAATEIRGVASEGEHLVICDKNMAQFTGKIMPQSPVKAVLKNDAVDVTSNKGFLYLNSEASSTLTGILARSSITYCATTPT